MHNIPVPPPPKQQQSIGNFKKSTAICKVYNVGLRYIKYVFVLVFIAILGAFIRIFSQNLKVLAITKTITLVASLES